MTKRHHLNQLPPEKLKEATIKEEWILKDYQKFRTYGAQYIGAAALAFLYQKGRLHDNEFEFLFYRKNIYHAEDYMTPKQAFWRGCLIDQMESDLEKWTDGVELKPKVRTHKKIKTVQDKKALAARKKEAREKFYADLRAKKAA